MPHIPRYILPGVVQAVVIRTVQSRFLLRPSGELNLRILGVIGKAQQRLEDLEIFSIQVLSNHIHTLLRAPDANTVVRFMEYVESNSAREAGRKHAWRNCAFWSKPYSNANVLDDAAIVRQLQYHFAQGCKDVLVSDPRDWPGVHTARESCRGKTILWGGKSIDRTGLYEARRRGESAAEADFTERVPVVLSPIPPWADKTPKQYARACRKLVAQIQTEAAAELRASPASARSCSKTRTRVPTKPSGPSGRFAMPVTARPGRRLSKSGGSFESGTAPPAGAADGRSM